MALPALMIADKLATKENINQVGKAVTNVVNVSLGLSVAAGTFFLLRHGYRSVRQGAVDRRALDEGSPQYFATQIGVALNTGSMWSWAQDDDEEYLYHLVRDMPVGSLNAVERSFRALYSRELASELRDKLSREELTKVLSILSTK